MLYLCEIFFNKCTGGLSSTVAARRMNKRECLGQKRGLRSAQQATTRDRERASEGSAKTYLDSLHTAHSQEWKQKRDKTREEAPVLTRLRVQWGRQSHTQQRQGETQTRHTRQEGGQAWILTMRALLCSIHWQPGPYLKPKNTLQTQRWVSNHNLKTLCFLPATCEALATHWTPKIWRL